MKKFFGMLTLALSISALVTAQDKKAANTPDTKLETVKDEIVKPSRDFFMLQLTYENWNQTPDDIRIGGVGRGFNAYLCYDFPIAKSHFSFAAGLGIGSSNIYFKDQIAVMNTENDSITFANVDTASGVNLYKRSKLNTTYLEAPFELRFFGNKENRNKGFKAAIGMRVGLLVGAHSKVRHSVGNTVITEKVNTKRYIQTWRFAPTFRIGWGNLSLYGSYNVSPLFKAGQGPEVFPYSIGICLSGL